jgi:hypothetical protein
LAGVDPVHPMDELDSTMAKRGNER